jgi:hypothetical protein
MIPFEGIIVKGAMLLKGAIVFKGAELAGFKATALLGIKRIAKIEAKQILKGAGEAAEETTRVRHYTNRKGIAGIEEDGVSCSR